MNATTNTDSGNHEQLIARARAGSRFASRILDSRPELALSLADNLGRPYGKTEMEAFLAAQEADSEDRLKASLRNLRLEVILRLLTRDLGGLADLPEVMSTMTALAETAVQFAVEQLNRWLEAEHGPPIGRESGAPQRFTVVGMGKLGGGELNVSSDIDLIFVYGEEGETAGPRQISNQEYFTRLGRRLIGVLSEITSNGYVFRVDMRLRPYGDSGPLVSSLAMLENYLITQGREWERYAWIKGRPLGLGPHEELIRLIRPFVFRKYLDFGAFSSMRSLHAQIRQEVQRRELSDNIKLGPGGIREVEFIAQVFQLIRGGQLPELQIRPTLEVLAMLGDKGLLPSSTVEELTEAYILLRNLEHRLQYLDDAQTQNLPRNEGDQALIAETMGFTDYVAFRRALDMHRTRVTRHFEQVFAAPQSQQTQHPLSPLWLVPPDAKEAERQLSALGYTHAEGIWQRLQQLRAASRYARLPASARARFDALVPPLIEVASSMPGPDVTLERILVLLEHIGGRESYLALMVEYPQTLAQVARLCSASPWAAQYLARHPILLDELLDIRLLYREPDWPSLGADLGKRLAECDGDTERQMDLLRHFKHTRVFHLLAQDLAGALPLERLSDHLSHLADLILRQILNLCWTGLRQKHRPEPGFAIVGYGKLGGKELGYASDLDIIFLYQDDEPEAPEIYARLAQRINSWLTSLTPAGTLYETDLRLRPDGAAGLLVSSVAAFSEYQREKAWVWEHQALTRARFVTGDPVVGDAFETIRRSVLVQPRDTETLKAEVVAMRKKMVEGHPNASGLFDIKHDRGGIVDVEFVVQYLILAHAHRHSALSDNIGNLALLKLAGDLGLIPTDLGERARISYREFRRLQHQLRLQGMEFARITPAEANDLAQPVLDLWQTVFGKHAR